MVRCTCGFARLSSTCPGCSSSKAPRSCKSNAASESVRISIVVVGSEKGVKLSLPSFPEGLVAAALRLGRHHLRRRRVHHGAAEVAGVTRRRCRLHVARLHRRRLHVRLPRRQRGRRRCVASRRRVRCFAEATGTEKPRGQFSSAAPKPAIDQAEVAEETKVPELARGSPVTGACC
jgi:hypothetical protein